MYAGPPGRPHWEAREDASRTILVALYLRDALGARDPSGLPPMLGTGFRDVPPANDETTYWWMRWWISVVEPTSHGWGVPLQEVDDAGLVDAIAVDETTRNEAILYRDALAPIVAQIV